MSSLLKIFSTSLFFPKSKSDTLTSELMHPKRQFFVEGPHSNLYWCIHTFFVVSNSSNMTREKIQSYFHIPPSLRRSCNLKEHLVSSLYYLATPHIEMALMVSERQRVRNQSTSTMAMTKLLTRKCPIRVGYPWKILSFRFAIIYQQKHWTRSTNHVGDVA